MDSIIPCLWFDDRVEEAVNFYLGIFPDSKIIETSYYPPSDSSGESERRVLLITFTLRGQTYTALNGGPQFQFNEAVSFQIMCEDQAETDFYWEKLSEGGDPAAQQCGWLKDKYGLSWQVIPKAFLALMQHPDNAIRAKAFQAIHTMKKLDLAALQAAVA